MKKFLLFLMAVALLLGFNYKLDNTIFTQKKPNNFYYTNLLAKNLTLSSPVKCTIEENNFHDEMNLNKDNIKDIKNMLSTLNKKNFIAKPKNLPKKSAYRISFTFNKEKLLIDVYNEKYLSIYPWDGDYPMDYLDTSNIPASLNLYYLGKYIFKQY
ncbi:DUF4883 family protein [Clostridium sp. WILCCON 0269]|uniref:DUF4883 family protein n=1 Tax=Candidatus Clostridium eludens TaxID=3381663 RepID=A0ABW8SMW4_9CLOT